MATNLLIIIGILVTAFIVRLISAVPVRIKEDTYAHLYYAHEIHRQKKGPFSGIHTRVATPERFRTDLFFHPFLFNYILGLFAPPRRILKYQHYIGPFIDASALAAFSYLALEVGFSLDVTIAAGMIYLFSPIMYSKYNSGPRIDSLTPRLPAEIAVTLIFFSLAFLDLNNVAELLLIYILSLYVIGSSKFGGQALLLIGILSAILIPSLNFIIATGLAYFSIYIAEPKNLAAKNRMVLAHLKWYANEVWKNTSKVSSRSSARRYVSSLSKSRLNFFKKARYYPAAAVAFHFPVVIVYVITLIFLVAVYEASASEILEAIDKVVLSAIFIFAITSLKWFLFLGESERYLRSVGYLIILATLGNLEILNALWVSIMIILYGIFFWIWELKERWGSGLFGRKCRANLWPNFGMYEKTVDDDEIILEWLKKRSLSKILCVPYHFVGTRRILLETEHEVIFPLEKGHRYFSYFLENYGARYPYIEPKGLPKLIAETGLNVIIMDSRESSFFTSVVVLLGKDWKEVDVGVEKARVFHRESVG